MTLFIMLILTGESINGLEHESGQNESWVVTTAFVYPDSISVEKKFSTRQYPIRETEENWAFTAPSLDYQPSVITMAS